MKWPQRLLGDIAAEATYHKGRRVTEHRIKLALALRYWGGERGQTLAEARKTVAQRRGLKAPYSAGYVKQIARDFGLTFADFTPRNPLNLPLE